MFVHEDRKAAVLQTDASQGIARAQRLLALRYLRGRGVPKDEAIAFYWMQLAAQQHFSLAQRSLGELYENGFGIALDITQASHSAATSAAPTACPRQCSTGTTAFCRAPNS